MMKGVGMATDNSATPGFNLPWAGKKVSQDLVEDELTSLWHLAADNMRISQNMNVRTSVLNFVICAQDVESARSASTLLRELSSTHIARVTLLILDMRSDAPAESNTWVTLRSFPIISDIMRHHFEQVTVTVHGAAAQYAANIVQTLLKPDLPVYLWWLNDLPADENIFKRLAAISSRVIVDSSDFFQPEERLRTLSSLLKETPDCAPSDLNWGRVTAWRELIAQFFDVTEYRPYLMGAESIEIEHAVLPATSASPSPHTPANPIGALLLAAWLKTRLGWQMDEDDDPPQYDTTTGLYSWHMSKRDMSKTISQPLSSNSTGKRVSSPLGGIHISIRPHEQETTQPGMLCLVRIVGKSANKQATFIIARGENDDYVQTSVELPNSSRPQRTVNVAATHKESQLLYNELEIMGRDHLYEETLNEAFALLG